MFSGKSIGTTIPINTWFTLFALVAYPVIGAILSAIAAVIIVAGGQGQRLATNAVFWPAASSLILSLIFGAYGASAKQLFVLVPAGVAIALATARLWIGDKPQNRLRELSNPLTISLVLVGGSIVAEPRDWISPSLRITLVVVYGALVLVAAAMVNRMRSPYAVGELHRRSWRRSLIVYSILVLMIVGATLLTHDHVVSPDGLPPRRAANGRRPNVILITLDSVRADHLSLYGYARNTTPVLKEFATTAFVYTSAISSANHTLPSHGAIFTGMPPSRNGADRYFPNASTYVPNRIGPKPVLAELLLQRGYRTGGFAANTAFLLPIFGFDRGFEIYDCEIADTFFSQTGYRQYLLRSLLRHLMAELIAPVRSDAVFLDAEQINQKAINFVRSARVNRDPFFLFLNYMDAHSPYVPPHPYEQRFPGNDPSFRWAQYSNLADRSIWLHQPMTDREFQHLTSQYDGSIAYLDRKLGELFERLRELDALQDTLVVITADHGEGFGESYIVGHGISLYQHQIHVPLIIKFPESRSASTVISPVSAVDILPTIMDVAGAPLPQSTGISLFHGDLSKRRWVMSESYHPRVPGPNAGAGKPVEIAYVFGTLKEIFGSGRQTELYDLSSDPNETTNLFGHRDVAPELQSAMAASFAEERSRSAGDRITDERVMRRLRALNYLR
jgi:arylsulfatase A-like enzyme